MKFGSRREYIRIMKYTSKKVIRAATAFILIFSFLTGIFLNLNSTMRDVSASDAGFEASIAGFPDSYKDALRSLHQKHPNWTFVPYNTGLDWNLMLSAESRLRYNLVPNWTSSMTLKGVDSSWYKTPTSWLSTDISGAYNWSANDWVVLNGSYWVQASQGAIAYIMDPRNWLTENNVFMFESLLSYNSEVQTYDVLKSMMDNTFMDCDTATVGGTSGKTYATVLLEVAAEYDISPVFLCTRIIQEKGTNNDRLGSGVTSNGTTYYNFFNIGATGSNDAEVQATGLAEAVRNGWTSQYLAIRGGASTVKNNYIRSGRSTLYFQKFWSIDSNYTLYQYMQNLLAPVNEGYTTMSAYSSQGKLNSTFVFTIPVYENMPSTACGRPTPTYDTTNPNYKLSSISVKGTNMEGATANYSLTPTFNMDTTSYSISVPYNVASIDVSASAFAGTSTITGTGKHSLAVGNNTISVVCKAEFGTSRTYTITVNRSAGSTYLTSLTPGTGTLDKTFNRTTFDYTVYVANSTTSLNLVYAKDSDNNQQYVNLRKGDTVISENVGTTVTISDLEEGSNDYYLDVYPSKSDTSSMSTYKITVNRLTNTTYDLSSYQVSGAESDYASTIRYINGFAIGETVGNIISKLKVTNGSVKIVAAESSHSASAKSNDSVIATGDMIYIMDANGTPMQNLEVILYGDVNGDGLVNLFDRAYIKRYLWGYTDTLTGIYLRAGDVYSASSGIDLYDRAYLKRYLWGMSELSQTR